MKSYSAEIAQVIREYLEEHEMKLVAFDEANGCFSFVMHLHDRISFVHYVIKVHDDDYTVVAVCPVCPDITDAAARAAMAEFICRANYGMKNGNFEMDFHDGELRYKCFVDCDDQIPSQGIVGDSIRIPAMMMKKYAPGILNVLFKDMDPETAVEECEEDERLLRKLEEMERVLMAQFQELHSTSDSESDSDDAVEEEDDGEGILSFEEYDRMTEFSENAADDDTQDPAD